MLGDLPKVSASSGVLVFALNSQISALFFVARVFGELADGQILQRMEETVLVEDLSERKSALG